MSSYFVLNREQLRALIYTDLHPNYTKVNLILSHIKKYKY